MKSCPFVVRRSRTTVSDKHFRPGIVVRKHGTNHQREQEAIDLPKKLLVLLLSVVRLLDLVSIYYSNGFLGGRGTLLEYQTLLFTRDWRKDSLLRRDGQRIRVGSHREKINEYQTEQ